MVLVQDVSIQEKYKQNTIKIIGNASDLVFTNAETSAIHNRGYSAYWLVASWVFLKRLLWISKKEVLRINNACFELSLLLIQPVRLIRSPYDMKSINSQLFSISSEAFCSLTPTTIQLNQDNTFLSIYHKCRD